MLLKMWNAFTRQSDFEVLGAKITRRHAATVLLAVYCFAFTALVVQLGRLHEALRYIPDAQFSVAATVVVTHAWLLNPFSYLGNDSFQILVGAISLGLWPILWWIGLLSIITTPADPNSGRQTSLLVYYGVSSFAILLLILFIYGSLSRGGFGRSYWISVVSKLLGVVAGVYFGNRFNSWLVSSLAVNAGVIEGQKDVEVPDKQP